jgi:tetratricopeptide (TPR) repeat protein
MKRVLVAGGAWCIIFTFGAIGLAADVKRQGNQPAPAQPAANPGATSGSARFVPPSAAGTNPGAPGPSRQSDAVRAAQAAQAAAAMRSSPPVRPRVTQPPAIQPVPPVRDRSSGNFYGNYPYRGYGYPYGTTPYVLGYDPYSGQPYLYPGGYYGYSPYGYGNGYPYYGRYLGFGYPGAVFVDPGQLFGIGPIQQLMGVNPGFNQQPNVGPFANVNPNPVPNGNNNNANPGFAGGNQPGANQPGGGAAANVPAPPQPRKAAVGAKANELAWKFITFGDARFGELKYSEALDRYRRAAREAPTLGDAWFREGFALAAMGKFDQAAKAMRRGLEEKPDWADANFRLDEVYGDNAADKKAQVDAMIKKAEAEPTNGDLALVVGIHLYCDGKIDQAAPFFRRAAQIQGNDANIKAFLPK